MNPIQSKSLPALAAALAAAVLTTIPARGAPWTPADLPQPPALWLDASDLSASPVSAWNDKSGNSRNFAQATGANQPAYSATSFNTSYPGVTFDGSSDFMSAGDTLDMGTNSLTVMSAVRYATSNNSGTIIAKTRYAGGAGRWTLYRTLTGATFGSGTQYDTVLQPDFLPGAILQVANSSTSARINGFVLDRSTSGSCKIWNNGTNTASATFTGNTTDFNNTDQLWLGAFQNSSGTTPPTAGSYLNGVIAEVVVVQTAMSDTDRQKLEGYLAWKWGMQANLPVGHPYESAAPESSDTTPPTIATLNPTDDASDVLTYANLSATFNEVIQKGTGNITLKKSADNLTVETFDVATSPRITVSGATLTIDPTGYLDGNTGYYVEIDATAVKDMANNSFAGIADTTTWNFTTGVADTTAPTIATLSPADDATDVAVEANLVATFDENIQKGTGNITLKKTADNSEVETFDVATSPRITVSGATLTIDPTANLALATGYYVQIDPTAIQDLSGNSFVGIADSTTWNFTTTSSIPVLNPSFQTPVLGDNADAVGAPTGWTATSPGGFSTWNPPDTIFAGAAGNGTPTGADGSQIYNFYHNAGASARLYQDTTAPLTAGMTYTLTVAIGARLTGNAVDVWGIDLMTTGQALGGTPEAAVYLARTTGGRADLTSGQFVDKTVQFTVPAGHPNLGQNVRVHCWSKAAANDETIAFDNVRLGAAADTIPPTLVGIVDDRSGGPVTVSTVVTYTVSFSEDMDAATVSAADFGNAGTATVSIGTVTETTAGVFTVQVTPTSPGTLQLKVNAGADLKDVAGNALVTTSAIADDTTLTVYTAYQAWLAANGKTNTPENLSEFAFGTTNTGALVLNGAGTSIVTRGQAPIIQTTVGSAVVTLTYARRKNSGCTYSAEFSTDLTTWLASTDPSLIYPPGAPAGETVVDNGDEMEIVSIKFPLFRNTGSGYVKMEQNFCQVRVTNP